MDFCCGTTMMARLGPLYSEGRMLLADVPFLVCPTCGHTVVAPAVELDVTMYAHYCDTDGVDHASLFDVVDQARIQETLDAYPDPRTDDAPFVTEAQLDHMLDLWLLATDWSDADWLADIRAKLQFLQQVRSGQRQLQEQR